MASKKRDELKPEWEYTGRYPSLWEQTEAGKLAEKKREEATQLRLRNTSNEELEKEAESAGGIPGVFATLHLKSRSWRYRSWSENLGLLAAYALTSFILFLFIHSLF